MALMVYRTCCKVEDLDKNTKSKMVMNIIIDAFIGLVPFLGDVADALWRCNTKNAIELEKFLVKKGQRAKQAALEQRTGTTQHPMVADQPGRTHMAYQGGDSAEDAPPQYEVASADRKVGSKPILTKPQPVKTTDGSKGGWFGGFKTGRTQERDVERG